jgi:hypothetical protein
VSGVEEDWLTSIRSSRHVQGWAWDGEELTGGGFPTAAEAAAERSSSARGFPVRRAVKFWSSSCSRGRGSYWGGWIGRRRGERMGSMGTEAHRRGGSDGEVVPVAGVLEDDEEVAGKLLRGDVVMLVPWAGAVRLCHCEAFPHQEDLKVMLYQSQEADNTFITSDGTSPYNSMR